MKNFRKMLERIFIVPNTFDPDDLRRRQVLNTTMIFMMVIGITLLIVVFGNEDIISILQDSPISVLQNHPDVLRTLVAGVITIVLSTVLLRLNRSSRMPRNFIGWIFVMGIVALLSISDFPRELTSGRSIFVWAIPIALSVIALPPAAVFVVDFVIAVLFWFLGGFQWKYFQYYTLFEIYMVSFISWLGMTIAERAIRDARNESQKNRAILDGVADGVVVVGADNKIILANPVAFELTDGDVSKILSAAESTEIGGRILSLRWSSVQGVGRVAIVRDVSRQMEIERAKEAVLGVVSHEMRTPLAAILGFAQVLESRPVPGMATRIRVNAQRMLKLVNDLLDVAQLQARALTIHQEIFSPSMLTSYVIENFLKSAGEKGVVLDVHLSPALPEHVTGDVQRLEQVVSNLVENAIKFTDQGGRVDISFCAEGETDWKIVVKDTGIGIPPERLSDIFEPFRRASDYATRKHQGVGLGLSIAKKIVQLSGGKISVESIVGKGSTFTVTLPMKLETS